MGHALPLVVVEGGSPLRDYFKGSAARGGGVRRAQEDKRPLGRQPTVNRWPFRECPRAGLVSTQADG